MVDIGSGGKAATSGTWKLFWRIRSVIAETPAQQGAAAASSAAAVMHPVMMMAVPEFLVRWLYT